MALTVGTQLGSHEITALLGQGGMGEVYRARDLRLKREVAIKILPDEFSRDVDRVSRFQREAELLASLNHPNIGAIYDLQEANDTRFLVLELVEGETLAERIQRGPIRVEQALDIGKQICEALEAAHEKGVVHRDLKPANVKITPEGRVKVLDFGLAKALQAAPASGTLSNSPTLTIGATQAGVILGTAAYMSPEQVKGFEVDARSDMFSFGSVLYEMLTTRPAFQGDTAAEVLASALVREPDFSLLPPNLNPRIQELLQRCLQKNPKRRWQAVGDLRAELETVANMPQLASDVSEPRETRRSIGRQIIPILVSSIVFAFIASIATWNIKRPQVGNVVRLPFVLPDDQQLTSSGSRQLAVSPDGSRLVYAANNQLFIRAMSEMEARPIPGTDSQNASSPFFSPDGQWVGFYSRLEGAVKKVAIGGGPSITICKENGFNASWVGDQILFASTGSGIMRVSENGGTPEIIVPIKLPGVADNPQLLDNGRYLLFTLSMGGGSDSDRWDKAQIIVQSLQTGERHIVLKDASSAFYVPTGHLVYAQSGTLFAIPFDLKTGQVRGGAVPVIEGITRALNTVSGVMNFAFSNDGSLFYVPGNPTGDATWTLAFVDRSGKNQPLPLSPRGYYHPRISPDGNQIAFGTSQDGAIWVYDLKGGGPPRRLLFEGRSSSPIWSSDGRRITFTWDRGGDRGLFSVPAEGGLPERLTSSESGTTDLADLWLDANTLAFRVATRPFGSMWTLSLDGDRKPKPLAPTSNSTQLGAAFSPNRRWFAYSSNEIGRRFEIFVQPFPPTGQKNQISAEGGTWPLWSPDGKQLYYVQQTTGHLVAVDVHAEPTFGFGKNVALPIDRAVVADTPQGRNYDVASDGKFLAVMVPALAREPGSRQQINVVLNWFRELQERVPVR